jgi:hypothetical protein
MHPTAQIRKLADRHTTVTGLVPDIRAYLSKAAVCVVPLRIAMGVQTRSLKPWRWSSVRHIMANEALTPRTSEKSLWRTSQKSFAAATARLLTDQSLWEAIRENAKQFIDQNFRWERNLKRLDELIAELRDLPKSL